MSTPSSTAQPAPAEQQKKSYKDSLNLPQTEFSMTANLVHGNPHRGIKDRR